MECNIIHGDCVDASPGDYDVMIADPPYAKHVHDNAVSQSVDGGARSRDLGFDCLTHDLLTTISSFASDVKKWSIIYSDVESLSTWIRSVESEGGTYIRPMAWVRWSMPQLSGDRPPTGFELVTCYWGSQGGKKSWTGPGSLTHLAHKCLRGEGKHKCEKPLDQALDLVSWFSGPGDRILDPCAGSGTVGLSCRILGRGYTGYEIDERWASHAADRISRDRMSDRDRERYDRWLASQDRASADAERREANTSKVRAKLAAKRKPVEVIR